MQLLIGFEEINLIILRFDDNINDTATVGSLGGSLELLGKAARGNKSQAGGAAMKLLQKYFQRLRVVLKKI